MVLVFKDACVWSKVIDNEIVIFVGSEKTELIYPMESVGSSNAYQVIVIVRNANSQESLLTIALFSHTYAIAIIFLTIRTGITRPI